MSFYGIGDNVSPSMKCGLSVFQHSRNKGSSGTWDGRLLIDAPWLHTSHTGRQLRSLSNQLCTRPTQTCTDTWFLGRVSARAALPLAVPLTLTHTAHDPDVRLLFIFLTCIPPNTHTHTFTHFTVTRHAVIFSSSLGVIVSWSNRKPLPYATCECSGNFLSAPCMEIICI